MKLLRELNVAKKKMGYLPNVTHDDHAAVLETPGYDEDSMIYKEIHPDKLSFLKKQNEIKKKECLEQKKVTCVFF